MFTLSLYIIKQIINHHQTNIRKQTKNTTEIETETEILLLSALAKMPMDVLHINPEGNQGLEIKDELFFSKIFQKLKNFLKT